MPYNFNYGGVINTGELKGVINPVDPQDAATKAYVDATAVYITDTDTELGGKVIVESSDIRYTIDNDDSEVRFFVVNGSVTADRLADNAVITAKIMDSQVTLAKIGSDITVSSIPGPTADLSMSGHKITGLGTPTDDNDAATKNYVDTHAGTINTTDTPGYGINITAGSKHVISVDSDVIASRRYIDSEIMGLIDGAPASLDTLNELAQALNDDSDAFNTLNNRTLLDGTTLQRTGSGTGQRISVVNPFTADDKSKLDGIEAGADVTDAENVEDALTAGNGISISTNNTATVSVQTSDTTITNTSSGIAVDTDIIATIEYVDLGFVEHDNYAEVGVGDFTAVAQNSDLDTTSEVHVGTISSNYLLSFHESALTDAELSAQYYQITRNGQRGYYRSKYHSTNNEDNLEHLALAQAIITGTDVLALVTAGDTITVEHDTDSVSSVINFGYGLEHGNVGQIEVDTDIIADTDWVKTYVAAQDHNDPSAGFGLSDDSNTFNVDTDIIADTEFVKNYVNDNSAQYTSPNSTIDVDNDAETIDVDTDVIATRDYVDSHSGVIDTDFTAGYGITISGHADTDVHQINVDTDVIANRAYVDEETKYVQVNSTGDGASADGTDSIAIGERAAATASDSIHIGTQNNGNGGIDPGATSGIAIGHGARVFGNSVNSLALGVDAAVASGNPGMMAISPHITHVDVQNASYNDTDTDLTLATSGFVKRYVAAQDHNDPSAGFGLNDVSNTFNVDTDVIATQSYVDAHSGGNANLVAGAYLAKANDTEIGLDTDSTGFPLEITATEVSINTLFGRRIKDIITTGSNPRITFEIFEYLAGSISDSFTPSTLRWDQPLQSYTLNYANNDNFQSEYVDKLVDYTLTRSDGTVDTLTSDTISTYGDYSTTTTFSGVQTMDNGVTGTWSTNGNAGGVTIGYQFSTNLNTNDSGRTSTHNWTDVTGTVDSTPSGAGTNIRFDAIRTSQTVTVSYAQANDADNINFTLGLSVDGTDQTRVSDTDSNVTKGTSSGSHTFTGLTIYYDSPCVSKAEVNFVRPITVMDTDTDSRTYTDSDEQSVTPGANWPTWFISEANVAQTWDNANLGSLSNDGYATATERVDSSQIAWRGQNSYDHTAGTDGATVHLVVPSAVQNGFRSAANNSITFTPINGANGTALDDADGINSELGQPGRRVTNYIVYSFNVQPNADIDIQPF